MRPTWKKEEQMKVNAIIEIDEVEDGNDMLEAVYLALEAGARSIAGQIGDGREFGDLGDLDSVALSDCGWRGSWTLE